MPNLKLHHLEAVIQSYSERVRVLHLWLKTLKEEFNVPIKLWKILPKMSSFACAFQGFLPGVKSNYNEEWLKTYFCRKLSIAYSNNKFVL